MQAIARATLLGAAYNLKKVETKTGKAMISFSLRVWKQQTGKDDKVMFLPIVAFSKAAEVLEKYLTQGKLVYLDCDFEITKDKNGSDKFNFIVREFSFLGSKEE